MLTAKENLCASKAHGACPVQHPPRALAATTQYIGWGFPDNGSQVQIAMMTDQLSTFTTTYTYSPLQPRHIRLLEFRRDDNTLRFEYHIIHVELPKNDPAPAFEAVSYTWGNHAKVSTLQIHQELGHIALTANLTEALPHISQHSSTKRLWIDQLCINQADNAEKSIQVGLMSEVYNKADRVIVWLGAEDSSIRLCKEWLMALDSLLPTLPDADRTQYSSKNFHDAYRFLAVANTFRDSTWAPKFQDALGRFWSRVYFRRSWIVQEFLLGRGLVILAGDTRFTIEELQDMFCVPVTKEQKAMMDDSAAYSTLIRLKRWPHSGTQPLRFFRFMASCAREFQATSYGDILYSMTGLLEGLHFRPDYTQSTKYNFTRFIATVAQHFGSLDFLGLCAAKLDTLIKPTPEEVQNFPSWVPSWTSSPLFTPWRLVVGGTHQWMDDILWNACAGRKHTCPQPLDPTLTFQLRVRGKVIDYIDTISSTITGSRDFDVDLAFLDSITAQLQHDLPSCCGSWTPTDLVNFLNGPMHSGNEIKPWDKAEAILGPEPRYETRESWNRYGDNDALALRLTIGRGRRFAMTESGRLCLVPFVDSQASSEGRRGSPIAILHGCTVPLVMDCIDEERQEYRVVGEAYAEGIMHGEAVTWEDSDVNEFNLV